MVSISVVLYLVLRYLPQFDPKASRQTSNFTKIRMVATVGFAALTVWLWYAAGHQAPATESMRFLLSLIGLMLAGLGNCLTTVKPNWFIGIRPPGRWRVRRYGEKRTSWLVG